MMLIKFFQTCKRLINCCRYTPIELFAAKLFDVISYANRMLVKTNRGIIIHQDKDIKVFSVINNSLVGFLSFIPKSDLFEVYYIPLACNPVKICELDPSKQSESMGFKLASVIPI